MCCSPATPTRRGAVINLHETGPVVIEPPPGPYLGIVNDHHFRWIADIGIPGPDAGKMFLRTPGAGSLYWLGLRDKDGAYLDGGKTYKLSVPQPVPQKLFWSVTVYDSATRSGPEGPAFDGTWTPGDFEEIVAPGSGTNVSRRPRAQPRHVNSAVL
jgi:hypothetical protein